MEGGREGVIVIELWLYGAMILILVVSFFVWSGLLDSSDVL